MLPNRLHEERQTSIGHKRIPGLPSPIIQQVIFETPEADTVSAEEIARFEAVAQQAIDQKLIAVREEASRLAGSKPSRESGLRLGFSYLLLSGRLRARQFGLRPCGPR